MRIFLNQHFTPLLFKHLWFMSWLSFSGQHQIERGVWQDFIKHFLAALAALYLTLVTEWLTATLEFWQKSDFWELRPFRHFIRVMSGQNDKKTKRRRDKDQQERRQGSFALLRCFLSSTQRVEVCQKVFFKCNFYSKLFFLVIVNWRRAIIGAKMEDLRIIWEATEDRCTF